MRQEVESQVHYLFVLNVAIERSPRFDLIQASILASSDNFICSFAK
jgi:hypothetical protein